MATKESRRYQNRQRRAAETPDEKQRRLDRLKQYRKWRREAEIAEQTETRRSLAREQQRTRRESQVRETRLERMREHVPSLRSEETSEDRAAID